ncbi:LAQU0S08e02410g1_1 [Lachancea quebecensis]|uniref:LAQU0S08e02410g1_1 n=1 Tax=Lachancea quebecensis TaxID=1654605 RepID=A0A0N7MLS6_9SACH|nr:LAQU0S08e02410g1_1 [Lachancea quebecensis]
MLRSTRRYYSTPPTYFGSLGPRLAPAAPAAPAMPFRAPREPARKPFLELAMLFSVLALSFFAVDNYRARLTAELRLEEQALKARQAQELIAKQLNAQRKKRELQILNERKLVQTRQMKVALHVAMLRKQLLDAGLAPASIEDALQEFERHVRMENSISNVSGTRLWVTDESPAKQFVPDVREYEARD